MCGLGGGGKWMHAINTRLLLRLSLLRMLRGRQFGSGRLRRRDASSRDRCLEMLRMLLRLKLCRWLRLLLCHDCALLHKFRRSSCVGMGRRRLRWPIVWHLRLQGSN